MIRYIFCMLRHYARLHGLRHPLSLSRAEVRSWKRFWQSYRSYNELAEENNKADLAYLHPCLGDDTTETVIEPIYYYQDWWAFRRILNGCPNHHVDVGSHHKFVALLSTVVPVTMVDIRPLSLPLETLHFMPGTIVDLPFQDDSVGSLSCLCVVEHIGLGRYGDTLDPDGSEKAIAELKRVIKCGGNLYLSAPIDDDNRCYFNAHRAFSEKYLISLFDRFTILQKRYIYGARFTDHPLSGFGTGLYHLQKNT